MRGFIVPHSHWDREWYLTFQQFRFKLVKMVDQVLDILEQDPQFKYFTLDGQTVVLEDYLEIKPGERGRIKKLIRDGRLLIGPWYGPMNSWSAANPSSVICKRVEAIFLLRIGMLAYVPDQFCAWPSPRFAGRLSMRHLVWGVGSQCITHLLEAPAAPKPLPDRFLQQRCRTARGAELAGRLPLEKRAPSFCGPLL